MDEWRRRISDDLEKMVDRAVTAGARQEDIFVELASSVEKLKSAHDRDPDPADAPSEIAVDDLPTSGRPQKSDRRWYGFAASTLVGCA